MTNKIQIKRTSVSGRTPNTSDSANSSFIDYGELAVNFTDGKLFSTNGSVSFEIGANLTNLSVSNTITINGVSINSTSFSGTANNANYLDGQSLSNIQSQITGNSATAYTNAATNAAYMAGQAYSNAVANASALYQTHAGLSSNVATLTSNATTYLGNSSGTVANITSWITGNAATAYANAVANSADLYQTTAGLSANVVTLTSNATTYLGNSSGTVANIASWITGNAATAYANAATNAAYMAGQAYSNAVANASALYQTTAGLSANVATLTANNTSFVGTVSAANVVSNTQLQSNLSNYALLSGAVFSGVVNTSANVNITGSLVVTGNLTIAGQTTYVNTTIISTSDKAIYLSANSTSSLNSDGSGIIATNAATLLYNDTTKSWQANISITPTTNSTFNLGSTANYWSNIYANQVYGTILTTSQPNITANNSTYFNGVSLATVNTSITGNAATSYSNAVANAAYMASQAYANAIANAAALYQTVSGLSANVLTLTSNNALYLGGVVASKYVNTSGNFILSGNIDFSSNVSFQTGIYANGSVGSYDQALTSNGTIAYWRDNPPVAVDLQMNGFLDGNAETTISFDGTNTFTLTDTGSGWHVYLSGKKYAFSGNRTVTLAASPPATAGRYYVTIDNTGNLSVSNSIWDYTNPAIASVAFINWNNSNTPKFFMSDERHTVLMTLRHRYNLHTTQGPRVQTYGALTYNLSGTTSANNLISISQTIIEQEDLIKTLNQLNPTTVGVNNYITFYRSSTGPDVWTWGNSDMPFLYLANGNIYWDNNATLTQGTNGNYYNSYILFTTYDGTLPGRFTIVPGRGSFNTSALAQAEDITSWDWSAVQGVELVFAYQLTWLYRNSYTQEGGVNLSAIRKIGISTSAAISSAVNPAHNQLSGLQGGYDSSEFYHLNATSYSAVLNTAALGLGITNGLTSNSTYVYVNANTGIIANATGIYVDPLYIANISSNNASYLGGTAASGYQTTAGLSANVLTLTSNATTYLGNSSGTITNIASWITGNAATAYTNSTTYSTNATNITSGTINTARLGSGTANSTTVLYGNNVWAAAPSGVNTSSQYTFTNVVTMSSNLVITTLVANGSIGTLNQILTSNGGGVFWSSPGAVGVNTDSQYTWSNTQTFSNTITFGNSSVNTTINSTAFSGTANNATNLGGLTLAQIQSNAVSNAATAYSNAIAFAANGSNINSGTVGTAYLGSGTANSSTILYGNSVWAAAPIGINTSAQYTFSNTIIFTGTANVKTYVENSSSPIISASSLTLDLSNTSFFTVNLNSNITTINITNTPATSGLVSGFVLIFTYTGTAYTVAWPASVRWANNSTPTLSSTNLKRDIFTFFTTDNGTSFNAFISGQNA